MSRVTPRVFLKGRPYSAAARGDLRLIEPGSLLFLVGHSDPVLCKPLPLAPEMSVMALGRLGAARFRLGAVFFNLTLDHRSLPVLLTPALRHPFGFPDLVRPVPDAVL